MYKIKEILLCLSKIVLAIVAVIMVIVAMIIASSDMTFPNIAVFCFLIITLYCLISKNWGIIPISVCIILASLYFFMLISSVFYQPVYLLLFGLAPIMAVLAMLKGKPRLMWIVVALIFLGSAVYYLFNNNIVGPREFAITDRPIDTPSQWGNNYRLYWFGIYASTVAWIGGIISIIVLFMYYLYSTWKDKAISNS
jgi:hypothetical protein